MKGFVKSLMLAGAALSASMALGSTAFAATTPVSQPAQVQPVSSSSAVTGPAIAIQPQGTGVPNSFWNLSGGNTYSAAFQDVSNAGIYTNYYFTSDAGSLYINNINLYGYNASDVPCEIDLWDRTTGQELYYTDFTTDTGNTYQIHYTGLNPNDQYYVGIRSDAINETISGNFKVSWAS